MWNNQTSRNLKIQSLYTHTKMCTICIYNNQMTLECMSLVVTDAYNSIQDVWWIRSHSSTLLCHSKPWLENLYGWLNCQEINEFVISHITKLAAIWFLSIWNKHFSTSTPLHQANILKHRYFKSAYDLIQEWIHPCILMNKLLQVLLFCPVTKLSQKPD